MLERNGYGWVVVVLALGMVATGCGNDSRGGGGRSGGRDGGIMLVDDGGTTDGGGSTRTDGGGGTMTDGGGGGSCRPDVVPSWSDAPPCSANLLTCFRGCAMGDTDCLIACVEMEPAGCGQCLDQEIISCSNANGCQDEWNCRTTCLEDNCAGMTGDALVSCAQSMCGDEFDAYTMCLRGLPQGTCSIARCIQSGGGGTDGGMGGGMGGGM